MWQSIRTIPSIIWTEGKSYCEKNRKKTVRNLNTNTHFSQNNLYLFIKFKKKNFSTHDNTKQHAAQ